MLSLGGKVEAVISSRKIATLCAKLSSDDKNDLLDLVLRAAALGRAAQREWRDDYDALIWSCGKLRA